MHSRSWALADSLCLPRAVLVVFMTTNVPIAAAQLLGGGACSPRSVGTPETALPVAVEPAPASATAVEPTKSPSLVLAVQPSDTFAEATASMAAQARKHGLGTDCVLYWGELTPAEGFVPVELTIERLAPPKGWIACGDDVVSSAELNPRLHQVVIVHFRDGELCASHPSGPGCHAFVAGEFEGARHDTFALLHVRDSDAQIPFRAVASQIEPLVGDFLFLMLELPPSPPEPAPEDRTGVGPQVPKIIDG